MRKKQQLYVVKLESETDARPDQQRAGLLAYGNRIMVYTRGHALKKARMFNGKIHPLEMTCL